MTEEKIKKCKHDGNCEFQKEWLELDISQGWPDCLAYDIEPKSTEEAIKNKGNGVCIDYEPE